MLKITELLKMSALITISTNNIKVVSKSGQKSNLSKSKKTKINKFKNPTKLKNLIISPNIGTNIEVTRFLTFKAKVAFT